MIKLDRLKAQLHISGLQHKDLPLFQVISELIDAIRSFQISVFGTTTEAGGGGGIGNLSNKTYLTDTDESSDLANSRQVLAGTGITFDDTVSNQRTLNVDLITADEIRDLGYWSPLTDGNVDETDLIFANGDAIMAFIPTP